MRGDRSAIRAEIFGRTLAGHIAEATPRSAVHELRRTLRRRSAGSLFGEFLAGLAGAALIWLWLLPS
jgi:hypothetical protein